MSDSSHRSLPRFKIRDLLMLVAIMAVLLAILLPALRAGIEDARRMGCANQFKQLGVALHNHHSAFKTLPSAMGGTASSVTGRLSSASRMSGLVDLLPFLEQQKLFESITAAPVADPWDKSFAPWRTDVPMLRCPSDRNRSQTFGMTNYLFSIGDLYENIHAPANPKTTFAVFSLLDTRFALARSPTGFRTPS